MPMAYKLSSTFKNNNRDQAKYPIQQISKKVNLEK